MAANIRKCTPADAALLARFGAELFMQAYGEAYAGPELAPYLASSFDSEKIECGLRSPDQCALLAESEGGEAIGYAHVMETRCAPDGVSGAKPVEVHRFYVEQAWHGRGVAGDLMTACEAEARARGGDVMWLQASREAHRAVGFYRRYGFEIVGSAVFELGSRREADHVFARPLAHAR